MVDPEILLKGVRLEPESKGDWMTVLPELATDTDIISALYMCVWSWEGSSPWVYTKSIDEYKSTKTPLLKRGVPTK